MAHLSRLLIWNLTFRLQITKKYFQIGLLHHKLGPALIAEVDDRKLNAYFELGKPRTDGLSAEILTSESKNSLYCDDKYTAVKVVNEINFPKNNLMGENALLCARKYARRFSEDDQIHIDFETCCTCAL